MHSSPSPGEKGSLATAPHSAKCTDRAATAPHSLHWVTSASASLGFATNVTPEEQQLLQTVCCFPEVATKLSASCPGSIHTICHVCTGDVFTHKRTLRLLFPEESKPDYTENVTSLWFSEDTFSQRPFKRYSSKKWEARLSYPEQPEGTTSASEEIIFFLLQQAQIYTRCFLCASIDADLSLTGIPVSLWVVFFHLTSFF